MDGERRADPVAIFPPLRVLTWSLPILLWGQGFLGSRFLMGCETPSALIKATAYALSGMAGWLAYLLINRSRNPQTYWLNSFIGCAAANVSLLNPTRTPWPFLPMLAHGVVVSVLLAVILSVMNRLIGRAVQSGRRASPASRADRDPKMGEIPGHP
ncbi:hypothetical protein TA3x_001658 [Tundrisphaera sp. TA3]|uniref:hypothetical protein n=1 Tax=Tundrisphaera sp. TA3 TaxID=3435775 RepID=UPI003EBEDE4B